MTFTVTKYKALKVFGVERYFHGKFDSLELGGLYKQKVGGHGI